MKTSIALCVLASLGSFASQCVIANPAYVSPTDAALTVGCTCVVGFSGCQSKLFDAVMGSQRMTWTQTVYVTAGTPADLDAACYRKRDVDGMGAGQCCTVPGDEAKSISNLFRGEPQ